MERKSLWRIISSKQRIAAIPPWLVMVGRPVTVFGGVELKWAEAKGYINKQYELLNSYLFTSIRKHYNITTSVLNRGLKNCTILLDSAPLTDRSREGEILWTSSG
jgi:hypothetical protein